MSDYEELLEKLLPKQQVYDMIFFLIVPNTGLVILNEKLPNLSC